MTQFMTIRGSKTQVLNYDCDRPIDSLKSMIFIYEESHRRSQYY